MTISQVQKTANGHSVTGTTAIPAFTASQVGSTLVATLVSTTDATAFTQATGTSGWTQRITSRKTGVCRAEIWTYENNPGGITAAQFVSGSGAVNGAVSEYTSTSGTVVLDTTGTGTANATTASCTATATASNAAGDVGIAVYADEFSAAQSGVAFTKPTGWTAIATWGAGTLLFASYYELGVGAGTLAATATASVTASSTGWAACIATLKSGTQQQTKLVLTSLPLIPGTTLTQWTPPADCSLIDKLELWGGNASGAGPGTTSGQAGGGGGAGAYARWLSIAVSPGTPLGATIGAGGARAVNGTGANGQTTSITIGANTYSAAGGTQGKSGTGSTGGTGGAGGAATTSPTPNASFKGGDAAAGVAASAGGGGGGSPGSTSAGGNASGSTGGTAGTGTPAGTAGAGAGTPSSPHGTDGAQPDGTGTPGSAGGGGYFGGAPSNFMLATPGNIHQMFLNDPVSARAFFDKSASFAFAASLTSNPVLDGFATTPVLYYKSYAQFHTDVTGGAITFAYHWVMYDPEDWSDTPTGEQNDPWTFFATFTTLAHAHGYSVILAPARDLGNVATSVNPKHSGESLDDWCIRTNLYGAAASAAAEIVHVQDQANSLNLNEYTGFFSRARTQALAHGSPQVSCAVSTNYGTSAQMAAAATSVLSTAAGFWVNIPDSDYGKGTGFLQAMLTTEHSGAGGSGQIVVTYTPTTVTTTPRIANLIGFDVARGGWSAANSAIGPGNTHRIFYSGQLPAAFDDDGTPAATTIIVSFKTMNTNIAAYVASIPTGRPVVMIYHHEPEQDYTLGSQFVAEFKSQSDAIRAAQAARGDLGASIRVCMCSAGYPYRTNGTADVKAGNYLTGLGNVSGVSGKPYVDFFGKDIYQSFTYAYSTPSQGLANYDQWVNWLALVTSASVVGTVRPLGIIEYGVGNDYQATPIPNATRLARIQLDASYLTAAFTPGGAQAVSSSPLQTWCYWYQSLPNDPNQDVFTDSPTVAFWQSLENAGGTVVGGTVNGQSLATVTEMVTSTATGGLAPTSPSRVVSAQFLAAITGSHTMAVRATVLTGWQVGTSPTGTVITVLGGDVQMDGTAQVRATLDLTTDGNGWDPRAGRSAMQPYGNEIYVERGVVVGGSTEWVGLGYFKIYSVEQDTGPNNPLRITGQDRMASIIDGRLPQPVTFQATDSVAKIFTTLVTDIYPDAVFDFDYDASKDQLGVAQTTSDDRYGFLYELITSRGKIMYFDYRGILVVKDAPDASTPIWTVGAGEGGVLVTAMRTLDRQDLYNAIVATADGATTDNPPYAIAFDNNPDSPTYYNGPFGKVPGFYSASTVTTAQQAYDAAQSILMRTIGLPFAVDFTAVPNPAMQPYDPVLITYGPYAAPETHIILTLTIPLTATDPLEGTTREQGGVIVAVENLS